jgi:hypothetical protein
MSMAANVAQRSHNNSFDSSGLQKAQAHSEERSVRHLGTSTQLELDTAPSFDNEQQATKEHKNDDSAESGGVTDADLNPEDTSSELSSSLSEDLQVLVQPDVHAHALPTLPRFPVSETQDTNCWSEPSVSIFNVRGEDYLTNKKKVASGPYLLRARGVDLFVTDNPHKYIIEE